ncbi:hypothetical protein [uncultured Dubosiella sp.]|uniref:hypothetical protein n=1 Tax=uncultured Dubosiella sp. TaxID=1937011 RepID=UPI0025B2A6F9|nr:hypothetical protein [uncultured Dubosiella sp.]
MEKKNRPDQNGWLGFIYFIGDLRANLRQDSLFVVAFFMRQQNKGDENRSTVRREIYIKRFYDFCTMKTGRKEKRKGLKDKKSVLYCKCKKNLPFVKVAGSDLFTS